MAHWFDPILLVKLLLKVVVSDAFGQYAARRPIVAALVGATIFGLNLYLTCRYFGMNDNDAFSAMHLDTFKNFLRMRIAEVGVTIYAIGLDEVPRRSDWIDTRVHHGQPRYRPRTPLKLRMIEKVTVRTDGAGRQPGAGNSSAKASVTRTL